MASYFDSGNSAHTDELPESVRTATDLAVVSVLVEAEVINHYTGPVPADFPILVSAIPYGGAKIDDFRYVYLRGYTLDSGDADVGADLKIALRRTIAVTLARGLRMWDKDGRALSENTSRGTKTFRVTAASRFPKGWDSLLRPFDTRPTPYVL